MHHFKLRCIYSTIDGQNDEACNLLQKVSYDDMTFDELIIDSAKSIANAVSSLIKAASDAQKELVDSGLVSKEYYKGSEDSQWSEGLVSAAKLVRYEYYCMIDN